MDRPIEKRGEKDLVGLTCASLPASTLIETLVTPPLHLRKRLERGQGMSGRCRSTVGPELVLLFGCRSDMGPELGGKVLGHRVVVLECSVQVVRLEGPVRVGVVTEGKVAVDEQEVPLFG